MKTIFALTMVIFSQTAMANDLTSTCVNRYREATLDLVDTAKAFNDGTINNYEFIARFAAIESKVGATRLVCAFEPSEIKDCVRLYKKQYHKIRDNVMMVELANGNQTRVNVGLSEVGVYAVDLKCQ